MATSGVTSLVLTARDVIKFALGKLNAIPIGQDPDITEMEPCILELNLMLKGWETKGPHLWRNTFSTLNLTANTPSYSMTADNPLRIVEMRYRYPDGHDLPMKRLSRIQYTSLPVKASNGIPTQYYFDPQENGQTLYIWPVPQVVTTDALAFTFQRRFQIVQSLNNTLDIPQEWLDTVGYNLAERLLPNYGVESQSAARIERTSQGLLRAAKAFDRPAFVQFVPEYRPTR
jgi:hypothetical protein